VSWSNTKLLPAQPAASKIINLLISYIDNNGTVIRNHLFLQQLKCQLDWMKEKVHVFHPNTEAKTLGSSSFWSSSRSVQHGTKKQNQLSSSPVEIKRCINWFTTTSKISTRSFNVIT